jgi:SAM-dependent methyltransferase
MEKKGLAWGALRRVFHNLPVGAHGKEMLKNAVYSRFPSIFGGLMSYQLWDNRRKALNRVSGSTLERSSPGQDYLERVAKEVSIFANNVKVHNLPNIFHYWSNKYLKPKIEFFGWKSMNDFFTRYLIEAYDHSSQPRRRFVSIGAGNCDFEARLAKNLVESGRSDFIFECLELNEQMLARGSACARELGVSGHILTVVGDFNQWNPQGSYDAVMANQSLHHVLRLERLFDAVRKAIHPSGLFVVSDMIGRNGHQRWPEALDLIQKFWAQMPESYRYNVLLKRQEEKFMDWDCSTEGFEGIRAQDILPLLIERFHFNSFLAFGNAIDPFIDRAFGHHFDPDREWDRSFIDRVHEADEQGILEGRIKPTHMMAALSSQTRSKTKTFAHLTPGFCVRWPDSRH